MEETFEIQRILQTLGLKDLSWLEGLAKFQGGVLLAKILNQLSEKDLEALCATSRAIEAVCTRYEMFQRVNASSAYLFGSGSMGQLGDGIIKNWHAVPTPTKLKGVPAIASISCGYEHTGIVTLDRDVYLFGNGQYGRLGDGNVSKHSEKKPRKVMGIPKVSSISCGKDHTAILTTSGEVYMCGYNQHGELGLGENADISIGTPRKIPDIPKISAVSCGLSYTGILTTDGEVYMFGDGHSGRLGDGDILSHNVPNPRRLVVPPARMIFCGKFHSGVVTRDGDVYMFGRGQDGRLGDGDITVHEQEFPKKITTIPRPAVAVSAGMRHTAVLTIDGDVYMFGYGKDGRLGDGNLQDHSTGTPKKIQNIPKIAAISCGQEFTGMISTTGNIYMFGYGKMGVLGNGSTNMSRLSSPTEIQNIPKAATISCDSNHCGFVTIPESSLNLVISCQMCGINQAQYYSVHHNKPAVFCSQECQEEFYY
jgi:alpha-tubulin suppressor-like RCC1 family protein